MLTETQLKRIQKALNGGTGVDIKISKTQIRKAIKKGGSVFSSLVTLGTKLLPYAGKAVPVLATGALSGLAQLGVDKIFGKGQKGGFLIPFSKLDKLIQFANLLTSKQKKEVVEALQTGRQVVIKPTKKQQSGGSLGAILASIGVPLSFEVIRKITGKGLQVDKKRPRRSIPVYVPQTNEASKKDGGLILPANLTPPPFFGTWENPIGFGIKKKRLPKKKRQQKKESWKGPSPRQRLAIQQHSHFGRPIVKFVDKPLSNIDLLEWVKQLGIKYFRGIYSRDNLPSSTMQKECGIINLDSKIGPGTHWVCYRNINLNYCEYFDSFGLIMPTEINKYLLTSRKKIVYSGDEIQERDSVLCGYWCLYYLLERQKGRSIMGTIHNAKFSITDQSINHQFIIDYFRNI